MLFKSLSSLWRTLVAILASVNIVTAQNHFALTGVKTGINAQTGYRPPRREIRDLVQDQAQWALYVQAMNAFMAVPETNLTSYFQVAGIHGRPYISWDNVNAPPGEGILSGYCTHFNVLFPTWHRLYLALVEQIMATFAQQIAKPYNSATYIKAANELRIPFWDWAALPQVFPEVLTWPSVRIKTATGMKNVTNPLYRYNFLAKPEPKAWFPRDESELDAYLAEQPFTFRRPDANNVSHDEAITPRFEFEGASLASQIWRVFAKVSTYAWMASSSNGVGSFEVPHGTVHSMIGGLKGHMNPVSFAAFEPAFWLHHANVDRQLAMWQAIYPDSWIAPVTAGGGTWTITPGNILNDSTPLTPFTMADKTTPWTSLYARYTKTFGYSYPDVQDWLPRTPAELAANVTARVNQLYNPDGTLSRRKRSVRDTKRAIGGLEKEWTVEVTVPRNALGESFEIMFQVGETYIGKLVVLSAPTKQEEESGVLLLVGAVFGLEDGLVGVTDEEVPKLLADSLSWTVVRSVDGGVFEGKIDGLEITVVDEEVTPAADESSFPTYGKKTLHPEIFT